MSTRRAEAEWKGNLAEGSGTLKVGSGIDAGDIGAVGRRNRLLIPAVAPTCSSTAGITSQQLLPQVMPAVPQYWCDY